ncbi:hypothetical protein KSP39_PZI019384 [Platanthera zijinensis]|uniref:Uncharacterized protein n=1 Tax=Platanthera zijinensis TaxID=2320716 RepID=A0AAP0FY46_9ASPA
MMHVLHHHVYSASGATDMLFSYGPFGTVVIVFDAIVFVRESPTSPLELHTLYVQNFLFLVAVLTIVMSNTFYNGVIFAQMTQWHVTEKCEQSSIRSSHCVILGSQSSCMYLYLNFGEIIAFVPFQHFCFSSSFLVFLLPEILVDFLP